LIISEFFGYVVAAYIAAGMVPFEALDHVNTQFAKRVDSAQSCWYRVDGTPGSYGSPHDYSLDLLCRHRMVLVDGDWKLKRI